VVWIVSILMGFIQSFVYAEIAGLYPHKSGGASVYGAAAWLPYSRFVAPISIWANWLAWSPVLTLATSLAAGYIMASLFAPDAAIMAWQIKLVDLGFVRPGSACGSTPSRSSPPASCCSLSCCSMAGRRARPCAKDPRPGLPRAIDPGRADPGLHRQPAARPSFPAAAHAARCGGRAISAVGTAMASCS
jgi:hypothetical protein